MPDASLARRLGAMLYDGLLIVALWMITTLVYVIAIHDAATEGDPVLQTILFTMTWWFFAGFWSRYGRTLGMQAWHLEIRTRSGGRPGFGRATLRFFAALVSWTVLGLGFIWPLWDRDGLSWHDRLSGTRLLYRPAGAANAPG